MVGPNICELVLTILLQLLHLSVSVLSAIFFWRFTDLVKSQKVNLRYCWNLALSKCYVICICLMLTTCIGLLCCGLVQNPSHVIHPRTHNVFLIANCCYLSILRFLLITNWKVEVRAWRSHRYGHGGQQRGWGPRPCSTEGTRGDDRQTDTMHPLYDMIRVVSPEISHSINLPNNCIFSYVCTFYRLLQHLWSLVVH